MAKLSSKEVEYVENNLNEELLGHFKNGRLSTFPSYLKNANIYHPISEKIGNAEISESMKKVNEASKEFYEGLSGLSDEFQDLSDNFNELKEYVNQSSN